ncbi:MAG: MCE family protein [Methylococcales bacterium]|jgi:paraquat-inducible protein B|nr:MCE family protein [Methylococcales bacterium]MBT7445772.1 MCE family protein [Methylococcales bacterium]
MNTSNPNYIPQVQVSKRKGISPIWLLPIIALFVGGWLIFKSISEAGISVEIIFDSANGLTKGKTKVIYQGLTIGKVKDVRLNDDMHTITAYVELIPETESALRENTKFWLVTPELSLQGISGLDTLVSGSYIKAQPGSGEPKRRFTALPKAPPIDTDAPGLHINLHAEELGSISQGAKIFFRQIQIGDVQSYRLSNERPGVDVQLHILPKYQHLIHKKSRFWNASGISIEGSLSGLKIRTESLSALISGGIGVYTPKSVSDSGLATNGDDFQLYESFDSAEDGIWVSIYFEEGSGLEENKTTVMLEGYRAGIVKKLNFDDQFNGVTAKVLFHPHAKSLLKKGSKFWLVKPKIGLGGISGLETIVSGNYIAIAPGHGEVIYDFKALAGKPALSKSVPGLHITLTAQDRGSIDKGSSVFYKKIPVGTVQSYRLSPDDTSVEFEVFIQPKYMHLIRENTHFWNASGITIKGKLTEVSVRAESIASLVNGGIAFTTPSVQAAATKNGQTFPLYASYDAATEDGLLEKWSTETGLHIRIKSDDLGSIQKESPIYYKKIKVGRVKGYSLSKNKQYVVIDLYIQPEYQDLVKTNSRFWNISGIQVSGGLSGVSIQAQSLSTIVEGGLAFFTPDTKKKTPAKNGQLYTLYSTYKDATKNGRLLYANYAASANLKIIADDLGSIDIGTKVYYQKIPVGRVTHFQLYSDQRRVVIDVSVDKKYRHLVTPYSRFWNVSGISAKASLSGLEIKTESFNALLQGGIAFYNPKAKTGKKTLKGFYTLYSSADIAKQEGTLVSVSFARNLQVKAGASVEFEGIKIGEVKSVKLQTQGKGVELSILLFTEASRFAKQGAQFWVVMPQIGLASTENIGALVSGNFLAAAPGRGRLQTKFTGLKQPPIEKQLPGLNIVLTSPQLGSLKKGDPIYYRQIKVGTITGYELSESSTFVDIHANISEEYQSLVHDNTIFWNMSGIDVDFSLWDGLDLKTSSLEAILEGGIGFATPNNDDMGGQSKSGARFSLTDEFKPEWLLWSPRIQLELP